MCIRDRYQAEIAALNARLAACREEDRRTIQLRQMRSDLYIQLLAALRAAKRYQTQGGTCMTIQQHPSCLLYTSLPAVLSGAGDSGGNL